MGRLTNQFNRHLSTGLICFATLIGIWTQVNVRLFANGSIRFPFSTSQLGPDVDARDWGVGVLCRQLGFTPSDLFPIMSQSRRLPEHSVYCLVQTLLGLPFIYRESQLVLSNRYKPVRLMAHHELFSDPPSQNSTLGLNDTLTACNLPNIHSSTNRLVYWPKTDKLRRHYELEDLSLQKAAASFKRVFFDAHIDAILQRLPPTYHGLNRTLHDFAYACQVFRGHQLLSRGKMIRVTVIAAKDLSRHKSSGHRNFDVERQFELLGNFYCVLNWAVGMYSLDDRGATRREFFGIRFHNEMASQYGFAQGAAHRYGKFSQEWIVIHSAMDAIGLPGTWSLPKTTFGVETSQYQEPPTKQEDQPGQMPVAPSKQHPSTDPFSEPKTKSTPEPKPAPEQQPEKDPGPESHSATVPIRSASLIANSDESLGSTQRLIFFFFAVAILFLLVGFVLVKLRPDKSRPSVAMMATETTPISGTTPRTISEGNRPKSMAASNFPNEAVGKLSPPDGSTSIPLGRELLISAEGLVIGRAMELCHVEIRDPQVSRRHLRLRLLDGAIWVEDLNSTWGTEVDAKRIVPFESVRLQPGQLVRIAGVLYQFESESL